MPACKNDPERSYKGDGYCAHAEKAGAPAAGGIHPALVDAQAMHRAHPATFEVPDAADLTALRPGDLVKVSNRRERFWVKLTEADRGDGALAGTVSNRLVGRQRYDAGDLVRLHVRNVYDIRRPRKGLLTRLLGLLRA